MPTSWFCLCSCLEALPLLLLLLLLLLLPHLTQGAPLSSVAARFTDVFPKSGKSLLTTPKPGACDF